MKKLISTALAICFVLLNGAPVDQATATKAADNWLNFKILSQQSGKSIERVITHKSNGKITLYTVVFTGGGFVTVAADDQISPILGYSADSPVLENIDNPALNEWLDNYSAAVLITQREKISNPAANSQWQQILNRDFSEYKGDKAVEPLVKQTWDQGSPYNMYTPNNWPVGCVATAMSQVMAYYHWPHTGDSTKTYTDPGCGQTLTANFGATTYDWSRMLESYGGNAPLGAKKMVATLSSHAGIAVSMNYGADGSASGITHALSGFKNFFRMKSTANIKSRNSYPLATWKNMVKAELDLLRPLYYRGQSTGGGHAFVCDGYDANDKYHFNWGWSGNYNGYFAIDALIPSGTGTGGGSGDYSTNNQAIFDLWDYNSAPETPVSGLDVMDKGNGTELVIKWNKYTGINLKNYRIRVGTASYEYTLDYNTNDTAYTISGLTTGTEYFVAVTALDQEDDESPVAEKTKTPNLNPVSPVNLTAEPIWQKIRVSWHPNSEMDIEGYNLYKSTNGIDYVQVNTALITDSAYVENNPSHTAFTYYKTKALDYNSNESAMSEPVRGRPISFDQGVLIVDESISGTGTANSPDDAMQDQFYDAITANVANKTNFDAVTAGKITLSDLGPYSTIIWHNQSVELGSIFNVNKADVKKYLDFGGKMLILADKPGKLIESNNSYPIDYPASSVAQNYFGIDSAFYKAAGRCNGATPFAAGYNPLSVDTAKALESFGNHIKKIETLSVAPGANVIYKYNSGYDITENYGTEKGKPSGVGKLTPSFKTVTLALPMYYIKENEAKSFIDHVVNNLLDINEENSPAIQSINLLQNYPNPFNPSTTISFFNPAVNNIKVTVYNAKGEMVKELFNGMTSAGIHSVKFDATGLNSGIYFYRLSSEKQNLTGKMLLVK